MAAALDAAQRQRLSNQGMNLINPRQGMIALGEALGMGEAQMVIMPIDWNKLLQAAGGHTTPFLEGIVNTLNLQPAAADGLQALREASPAERPALTLTYIQTQIARIMRLPKSVQVSGTLSLNALGIDSLMAVELRNRIKDDLGVDISLTTLLQELTVQQLARQVSDKIAEASSEQAQQPTDILDSSPEQTTSDLLQNLDQLSDSDIDALLGQMLAGQDSNHD
jgi:acyl carrier protein